MERVVATRQCPKILVSGTHSTGKTSFASALASAITSRAGRPRVEVIEEAARRCPFSLNRAQNYLSTSWLLAAQVKAEVSAQTRPGMQLVICDRGRPDILAYHQASENLVSRWMESLVADWLNSYDLVVVARPDLSVPMSRDPLRLDDDTFRAEVQRAIERQLDEHAVAYAPLPYRSGDRVAQVSGLLSERGLLP